MTLDRRQALVALGSGLATPAIGRGRGGDAAFLHGVASGDPARDGALLWTRATPAAPDAPDIPLTWRVAAAPDGAPVRSGRVLARGARDFTVKAEATGLPPGRDHWFWFETEAGTRSPVGRFHTLPVGPVPDLVLAVASCQLWPGGFFNAWRAIADLSRLDAVVHLGDYIYEYGADGYGGAIGKRIGRVPEPPHECVTLADYRLRHAQAKTDPDLQAAHARAAIIPVWDDHETANDSWVGGADNHQPATEGAWPARKAAAIQA